MTYDELLFALQKEADNNPGRLRQQTLVVVGKFVAIPIQGVAVANQQQAATLRVPTHSLILLGDSNGLE